MRSGEFVPPLGLFSRDLDVVCNQLSYYAVGKTVASVHAHGDFHDSSTIQSASSSDHTIGNRPSRHRCRLPSVGRRDLVGAAARKHAEDPDELGPRSRFLKSGDTTVLCQFFIGLATHEPRSHLRPSTSGRQLFIRGPAYHEDDARPTDRLTREWKEVMEMNRYSAFGFGSGRVTDLVHGRPTPTYGRGRVCAASGCGTQLSLYNPKCRCSIHRHTL